MTRLARPLIATATALAVLGTPGMATAQASGGWKIHKTLGSGGEFWDTAASSWWNAWAVGSGATAGTPLAWRWNGHTWAGVKVPSGTAGIGEVSTAGTGNTWMLARETGQKPDQLLLRWNKGTWTTTKSHAKGIYHIGAAGANQLWASGDGFIRHYDGKKWTDTPLPDKVSIARIAVNHYNDVWAVGWKDKSSGENQPFAMHWNGSSWKTTPVPEYPGEAGGPILDSVAFAGENSVYASGDIELGEDNDEATLLRWNGAKWSKVALPKKVSDSWMGGVGVTPTGGGGIWYAWAHRHVLRRTTSGAYTDYKLPAKTLPYVRAVAHIPGSKTTLTVGSTTSGKFRPFIALGK